MKVFLVRRTAIAHLPFVLLQPINLNALAPVVLLVVGKIGALHLIPARVEINIAVMPPLREQKHAMMAMRIIATTVQRIVQ